MERIIYSGDSILTGTDISRALLNYAEALARRETSATVDIPVRLPNGSNGRANLLIGPASQIMAEDVDGDYGAEVVDEELVADLHKQAAQLGVPTITPADPAEYSASTAFDLEIPEFYTDPTDLP